MNKRIPIRPTARGFGKGEFLDEYGYECSIQESSMMAKEGHIWFGIDDPKVTVLAEDRPLGTGWVEENIQALIEAKYKGKRCEVSIPGRMHLSQSHVKKLLPLLKYFAEHGRLPPEKP